VGPHLFPWWVCTYALTKSSRVAGQHYLSLRLQPPDRCGVYSVAPGDIGLGLDPRCTHPCQAGGLAFVDPNKIPAEAGLSLKYPPPIEALQEGMLALRSQARAAPGCGESLLRASCGVPILQPWDYSSTNGHGPRIKMPWVLTMDAKVAAEKLGRTIGAVHTHRYAVAAQDHQDRHGHAEAPATSSNVSFSAL
jgi:hypothetical protein